jgi:asparagine synthase (glutamine-hydrolysing)
MCGLTGLLRFAPGDAIIGLVAGMNARLVHRGPDDEGFWAKGGIGLGHRRLAIPNLSATGAQPILKFQE